jgi:hypothetical protein
VARSAARPRCRHGWRAAPASRPAIGREALDVPHVGRHLGRFALYLRNLILNWIVILPAVIMLLLILTEVAIITSWIGKYSPLSSGPLPFFLAAGSAGLLFALFYNTRNCSAVTTTSWGRASIIAGYNRLPRVHLAVTVRM